MKSKRYSIVSTVLAITVVNLSLLLVLSGPAVAHHRDAHSKGGGSTTEDTVTEDNDDDGAANSPDPEGDSDNKHPSGKDKHDEAGGSGNQGKAAADPDGDSNGGVDQPGGSGGDDELDQDGNNGCGNDDDFEDDNNGRCLGRQDGGNDDDEEEEDDVVSGQIMVTVCHKTGAGFIVITFAEAALQAHLDHGDIYPVPEGAPETCENEGDDDGDEVLGDVVLDDVVLGDVVLGDVVLGNVITRQPSDGDAVLGTRIVNDTRKVALRPAANASVLGARLPFTGAEIWSFLAVALGMIAVGAMSLRSRSQKA